MALSGFIGESLETFSMMIIVNMVLNVHRNHKAY